MLPQCSDFFVGRTVKAARRRAGTAAMMGFTLGIAAPAWGSSGHVALVRHDDADPIIAEAIHRVRGELVADGFDVSEVDSPNEPAAPELPPSEAPNGAIATIDLSVDRGTHIAELRVVDHLSNKIVIRHARVDDSNTPHTAQILAVRTVEFLRASLLELLLEADGYELVLKSYQSFAGRLGVGTRRGKFLVRVPSEFRHRDHLPAVH